MAIFPKIAKNLRIPETPGGGFTSTPRGGAPRSRWGYPPERGRGRSPLRVSHGVWESGLREG